MTVIEISGILLALVGILFAFETPRRRFVSMLNRSSGTLLPFTNTKRPILGDPGEPCTLGHLLENVRFFHTPPIDIRVTGLVGRVACRWDGHQFRLGLPANWSDLIEEIILHERHSIEFDEKVVEDRRKQLRQRVLEGDFAPSDQIELVSNTPDCETITELLADTPAIEDAKRAEFRDYLLGHGGFLFNRKKLAVSRFKSLRSHTEHPEFEIALSTTDYYTYRILSRFSSKTRSTRALREHGNNFSEYIADRFQKCVHLSLGLAIIVHSLRDNRVIVTRRSSHATNNSGEAGLYFMSANEGANMDDISSGGSSVDLYLVVERALKEELLGTEPQDEVRDLLGRIRTCLFVGSYLYMPNMSIGPCFYVAIDCDSAEIRSRHLLARDGNLETSGIIREERWDKSTGLPQFTVQSIGSFVDQTIGSGAACESWDEGALCALALALHGARAAGLCK